MIMDMDKAKKKKQIINRGKQVSRKQHSTHWGKLMRRSENPKMVQQSKNGTQKFRPNLNIINFLPIKNTSIIDY
jgi:hypothetical protein